ncbi:MAG: hypothetical protein ACUVV0_15520 [Anaerolineae bacterium]
MSDVPYAIRDERIVAIDWSGAAEERTQREKIWWCCAEIGPEGELLVTELDSGKTREEIIAWLLEDVRAEALLGFDFAFSLPAGYLSSRQGLEEESWEDVLAFCQEKGEEILALCPLPFWGRPGKKKLQTDAMAGFGLRSLFRRTDELAGAKKSVFQIVGAGTVGAGSLRGIPLLGKLAARGFHIWPFHGPPPETQCAPSHRFKNLQEGHLPGQERQPTVVEIYPRFFCNGLFRCPLNKTSWRAREEGLRLLAGMEKLHIDWGILCRGMASDDAFDALVSAVGMWRFLDEGGFDLYPAEFYGEPFLRSEGWIWGVPPPG